MTTLAKKPKKPTIEIELKDFKRKGLGELPPELTRKVFELLDSKSAAKYSQANSELKTIYDDLQTDDYWKDKISKELTKYSKLLSTESYEDYYKRNYKLVNKIHAALKDAKTTHDKWVVLFAEVVKSGCELLIPAFTGKITNYAELWRGAKDPNNTFLHLAVLYDHPQIVCFLLTKKVPIDPIDGNQTLQRVHPLVGEVNINQDLRGVTPLFRGAELGRFACLQQLINAGGNVNFQSSESGNTPLHAAAEGGHLQCFRLLIENEHTRTDIHNHDNKTALDCARENHTLEWQEYLKEHFPPPIDHAAH